MLKCLVLVFLVSLQPLKKYCEISAKKCIFLTAFQIPSIIDIQTLDEFKSEPKEVKKKLFYTVCTNGD